MTTEALAPFGPTYPALPGAAKFRKLANGRDLTKEENKAYGRAVLEGIRSLQRLELVGRGSSLTHKAPTLAQIFAGSYPRADVPASHKEERKFAYKGGMHEPKNWDPIQRSRYEAAMAETRAAREAEAAKREAATAEIITFPTKPAGAALVNANGSFNRGNIMREAHAMARANRAEGQSYANALSVALRTVWANARTAPLALAA